jgi:hypothetical protein
MDPQVADTWGSPAWVAEVHECPLGKLAESGDELGLHTHTWRWEADARRWIMDREDPGWGKHCVAVGLEAFEQAFGRRCPTHRGGDHFLSGPMLSCLEAAGVEADLTVESGLQAQGPQAGERALGLSPEYRGLPTAPYRSSPHRFPAPDPTANSGPLLIPLFSAPALRRRRAPLPAWIRPGRFVPRLAAELLLESPPLLAFAVRSTAALDPSWDTFARNLEHLARHRQARFITATAAARRFDAWAPSESALANAAAK